MTSLSDVIIFDDVILMVGKISWLEHCSVYSSGQKHLPGSFLLIFHHILAYRMAEIDMLVCFQRLSYCVH